MLVEISFDEGNFACDMMSVRARTLSVCRPHVTLNQEQPYRDAHATFSGSHRIAPREMSVSTQYHHLHQAEFAGITHELMERTQRPDGRIRWPCNFMFGFRALSIWSIVWDKGTAAGNRDRKRSLSFVLKHVRCQYGEARKGHNAASIFAYSQCNSGFR